jgi:serine/threonine protein kinase
MPSSKVRSVGNWDLVKTLRSGSFGFVFVAKHRVTGKMGCAKLERIPNLRPQNGSSAMPEEDVAPVQLPIEQNTYRHLRNTVPVQKQLYFPEMLDFGTQGKYYYMVMSLMQCDLEAIVETYSVRKKLLLLADALRAIETLHGAGIVHRDIKPRNFCVRGRSGTGVALIDFGLSKRFEERGTHIPQMQKDMLIGTMRYCSIATMLCLQASRRDDCESLVYAFLNVFGVTLPWQEMRVNGMKSSDEAVRMRAEKMRDRKILHLKQTTALDQLCAGAPECLQKMLVDIRVLGFRETPDYECYRAYVRQDL